MFCTKCAAEVLETDLFCPKCGQPIKHHASDAAPQANAAATPSPAAPSDEQLYSGYYNSIDEGKRSNALRVLLFIALGLAVIFAVYCGVMVLNDKNPITAIGDIFAHSTVSGTDRTVSDTETASRTDATTEPIYDEEQTTSDTTQTTASTTQSTAKPTTGTTAAPVGDLIRQTAVGSWKADISAIGLKVAGIQVKTITLNIDANGNADVGYKLGIIKGSTTGSFEVSDTGKTLLTIKVPVTGENVYMTGMSKVVDKNTILFTTSGGQTVKLERTK